VIKIDFLGRRKKSTVRDFLTPKTWKMVEKWFIAIYRKSGPTKSTVLGGPPPGLKFMEFIEKSGFFWFLGLQYSRKKRHQSRHLRPTPPRRTPKSGKFRKISIFNDLWVQFNWSLLMAQTNLSRPNLHVRPFFNKILSYTKLK
jgi:hypothetical protein